MSSNIDSARSYLTGLILTVVFGLGLMLGCWWLLSNLQNHPLILLVGSIIGLVFLCFAVLLSFGVFQTSSSKDVPEHHGEHPGVEVLGNQTGQAAQQRQDAAKQEEAQREAHEAPRPSQTSHIEINDTVADLDVAVLTNREREVLEMVAQGIDNRRIAQELHISYETTLKAVRSAQEALRHARGLDENTLRYLRNLRDFQSH